jgi:hypothetical protein
MKLANSGSSPLSTQTVLENDPYQRTPAAIYPREEDNHDATITVDEGLTNSVRNKFKWRDKCIIGLATQKRKDGAQFRVIIDHSINEILNSSTNTSYSLRLDKFRMSLMPFLDNIKTRKIDPPGRLHLQSKIYRGPR